MIGNTSLHDNNCYVTVRTDVAKMVMMHDTLQLAHQAQLYLLEALGEAPSALLPLPPSGLPFFITDSFDLLQIKLFGLPVTMAVLKEQGALTPAEVASRIRKIRALGNLTLYATSAIDSADRRRLIEQKVPFVVPGNQLYLPDLGIDLREHFRRQAENSSLPQMMPATQALLFSHLMDRMTTVASQANWHVAPAAEKLGYTKMSGSRAANELVELGLADVEKIGRAVHLRFKQDTTAKIWEAAKPYVRSPVLRTRWVRALPPTVVRFARQAGETALAKQTMLNEPEHRTVAIHRDHWPGTDPRYALIRPEPGTFEVQVWSYSTTIDAGDLVDPLSLVASLRDSLNERVRLAVRALEGTIR
ncbi:MAG: hypothetical protein HY020_00920 [Burkholderiales bacterium]|nr:hypothetical protein [Burkholderiales bacterium]